MDLGSRRAVSFLPNESASDALFHTHETFQEPAQGSFHKTGLNPFARDSQRPPVRRSMSALVQPRDTFYTRPVAAVHFMIVLSVNPKRHWPDPCGIKIRAETRQVPRMSKTPGVSRAPTATLLWLVTRALGSMRAIRTLLNCRSCTKIKAVLTSRAQLSKDTILRSESGNLKGLFHLRIWAPSHAIAIVAPN